MPSSPAPAIIAPSPATMRQQHGDHRLFHAIGAARQMAGRDMAGLVRHHADQLVGLSQPQQDAGEDEDVLAAIAIGGEGVDLVSPISQTWARGPRPAARPAASHSRAAFPRSRCRAACCLLGLGRQAIGQEGAGEAGGKTEFAQERTCGIPATSRITPVRPAQSPAGPYGKGPDKVKPPTFAYGPGWGIKAPANPLSGLPTRHAVNAALPLLAAPLLSWAAARPSPAGRSAPPRPWGWGMMRPRPTPPAQVSKAQRTGIAVADEPLAAQAGAAVLTAGGSAVDAVTTMFFTLTATYPVAAGLGGGGICLVRDAGGQVTEFDFLTKAPRPAAPMRLPGAVAGFTDMQRQLWRAALAAGRGAGRSLCRHRLSDVPGAGGAAGGGAERHAAGCRLWRRNSWTSPASRVAAAPKPANRAGPDPDPDPA